MKKTMLFGFLCFVFLMAYGYGEQTRPVAVSPGGDSGIVVVSQSCPTFSWSAVQWSNAYKVAVFPAVGAEVLSYEEMELLVSPVVSKEIYGPALSWTPSEAERLASGEAYVWYVQAMDASGTGVWSEGRLFQVEEEIRFFGIKKKLRESLKEYGMSEEDIERVVTNATAGLQTVEVQESSEMAPVYMGVDQGLEGSANTYYGTLAGDTATGSYNSFFGRSAGYQTTGNYNTFVGYFVGRYNQSGAYNTFMGRGSGKWNFTGWYNTYLGAYAGHNATSGYNTLIGAYAGYSNTSGGYNTFLGTYAGYYNTTAYYNTFLGYASGYTNTTGTRNTFVGYYAGIDNTTGNYNTALGTYAGYNNTTANNNTFIGQMAGYYNTTNTQNTYVGSYAGYYSLGNYNTFVGYYAGHGVSGGNPAGNTGIGERAGEDLSTGDDNVFVGSLAGGNTTTGYRNTYVGRNAGDANTTGYGNICLGYDAGGFTSTYSNRLYIDNSNTAAPLIFGDLSANLLRVYNTSTQYLQFQPGHATYKLFYYNSAIRAYTDGYSWFASSSRENKENIVNLDTAEAMEAFEKLEPVKFNFKDNKEDDFVGFIAEDVPDLVATKDKKSMLAMDVVAVLTKVVQEQQKVAKKQQETIDELRREINDLKKRK